MERKIIAGLVSLAAFVAFAVAPAIAAASPVLTENGIAVGVGASVRGTNSGSILFSTKMGNVECTEAQLNGTVAENSGTSIEINIEVPKSFFHGDDPEEAKCTSNISDLAGGTATMKVTLEGTTWCLSSGAKDTWSIRGGACGAAAEPLRFIFDVTSHTGGNLGACTYERAEKRVEVTGTFNTKTTPATLTIGASQTFTTATGTSTCPASGTLSGAFTLETPNGTGLSIS